MYMESGEKPKHFLIKKNNNNKKTKEGYTPITIMIEQTAFQQKTIPANEGKIPI